MIRFKHLKESVDAVYGDKHRDALDGLDAMTMQRIDNPEVLHRLNSVVHAHFSGLEVMNTRDAMIGLRAKLNIAGYDFEGNYTSLPDDEEVEIPLNLFGGRFGRGVEDDYYDVSFDDGIEPKTGSRYALYVTANRETNHQLTISGYIAPMSVDDVNESPEEFTAVAIVNNKVVQSLPITKSEIEVAIEFLKSTHKGAKVSSENKAGRVIRTEGRTLREGLDPKKPYLIQQNGKKYVLGTPVKAGTGEMRRPQALSGAGGSGIRMVSDKSLEKLIKDKKVTVLKTLNPKDVKYSPPPSGKLTGKMTFKEDIANVASSGEVAGLGSEPPKKGLSGDIAQRKNVK